VTNNKQHASKHSTFNPVKKRFSLKKKWVKWKQDTMNWNDGSVGR